MLIVMRIARWVGVTTLVAMATYGCKDDAQVVQVTARVLAEPAAIDFGTIPLNQDATETITLINPDQFPARLGAIEIEDDCGGCFVASAPSVSVIPANFDEATLQVRFRALRVEAATATLTISVNEFDQQSVTVSLIGRGREAGCVPDISVAPEAVDFGFVPAGGLALSSFVIRSEGNCDLVVDRIRVVPEDAPFEVTTSTPTPGNPGVLVAGAQASFQLRASLPETATGTATAEIYIETNAPGIRDVPNEPGTIVVPMRAVGNRAPIADAGDDLTVEPWSRATLSGAGSTDPDGADENLQYRWTLVSKPGGSTAELERSRSVEPSFWADLTGQYELELVVIDALGLESEVDRVVVEALPTNAIRIELTWDHPDSDVDLHLIRQGGRFCECVEDVHYRECGVAPDWFPDAPGANPRLDIDDRDGFGPENINLDGEGPERFIPDGTYTIAVHYFDDVSDVSTWPTPQSTATVRVFVFGLLAAEFVRTLENEGDLWTAAEIRWADQEVVGIDTITPGATCGIF